MFGIRVLIYLAGIALVVWILMRLAKSPKPPAKRQAGDKAVDDMVRCDRCGVFVPRKEAIRDGEHWYCSTAHRDEDRKANDGS